MTGSINSARIAQLALFELTRMFLTKRGLIALVAFVVVWLLILRYPIGEAVSLLSEPGFTSLAQDIFGSLGLSKLLDWPEAEFAMYWLAALIGFPTFCLFMCSDQTVEDRERGTLRFISLRATRLEILIGRFIGQLSVLLCLVAITLVATFTIMVYREPSLFMGGINRAVGVFIQMIFVLSPFVALMSLINVIARSSRLSFVIAVLFFALGNIVVNLLAWQISALTALNYVFPGMQIELIAGQNASLMMAYGLPVIQTGLFLVLAHTLFVRRAL
ncbi:ABC transporter permease subunit [Pseudoalteromonas sp. MMG010]|uniref:ABC transporter permease subunit n=1 Tax=Pseudoalteromonas sp. MMG010 TaxID=2822685 RepID=UPI001B3A28BD|nr:ABC transporter permease subunit [Pseudoalteromonas sp. MMG010]MBQ4834641.1 ABC transporter permease subunit [Pseudoalteromonas sp. MMG010]